MGHTTCRGPCEDQTKKNSYVFMYHKTGRGGERSRTLAPEANASLHGGTGQQGHRIHTEAHGYQFISCISFSPHSSRRMLLKS